MGKSGFVLTGPPPLPIPSLAFACPRRLSADSIYETVERLARRAGIAKCSVHDLRRSCATALLDLGADTVCVAGILGHSDPRTTALKYDRRPAARAQAAINKLVLPVDR